MNFNPFSKATQAVGEVVEKAGDAGDKLFTSDEERITVSQQMHQVDMMSDSWLSKNVRPLVFLSSIIVFFGMIIADGLGTKFSVDLFQLVGAILGSMITLYFGGRSVEKAIALYTKSMEKRREKAKPF
jgi:membrane protein DedA with SNARE-associated domain